MPTVRQLSEYVAVNAERVEPQELSECNKSVQVVLERPFGPMVRDEYIRRLFGEEKGKAITWRLIALNDLVTKGLLGWAAKESLSGEFDFHRVVWHASAIQPLFWSSGKPRFNRNRFLFSINLHRKDDQL